MDAASLLPGPVPVAVGPVDPVEPRRGTEPHRVGEPAARHLDQHLEAVPVHQRQIVPAVSVQVARHVDVEHFAPLGFPEVGRRGRQVAFGRRRRIEPGQPAAAVDDQALPAVDAGDVDEGGFAAQRRLDLGRPFAVREAEHAELAVAVPVDVDRGEVRDGAAGEEAGQNRQAFRDAQDDLVTRGFEGRRRSAAGVDGHRHHATGQADPDRQHRDPRRPAAGSIVSSLHGLFLSSEIMLTASTYTPLLTLSTPRDHNRPWPSERAPTITATSGRRWSKKPPP